MMMYYRLAVSILYATLEKGWQSEQAGSDKPHILSYVNISIYVPIQYKCNSTVSTGQDFCRVPLISLRLLGVEAKRNLFSGGMANHKLSC